jgi:DNA repair protein RadA/Sms
MAKTKTTFYCQNCGAQYAKWQGQCSSCKQWNTIAEEVIQKEDKKDWKTPNQATKKRVPKPTLVNEIQYEQEARYNTNNQELN